MKPTSLNELVNVSSIPFRSPFRYAGGKTWLIPYVRRWLVAQSGQELELIEPFAGGGIVSLTAIFEDLVSKATLVELDEGVAAVWKSIITDGDGIWLANKIANFDLNLENVHSVIRDAHNSQKDLAFATVVKNRVSRGGILAEGASFIKQGENGKGISSRWYPITLQKRITAIHQARHKLSFFHGDAFVVCKSNANRKDVIYFIDPPYSRAGRRLYTHSEIDHNALLELVSKLAGDFLMTYEDTAEISELANKWSLSTKQVVMKNTHHTKKTELLISRSFDWLEE